MLPRPLWRLHRCTKSVLLKVHSLRQLGKEKLTFGDSCDPADLSYIDFKVRSVILGEGSKRLEVRRKGRWTSNQATSVERNGYH